MPNDRTALVSMSFLPTMMAQFSSRWGLKFLGGKIVGGKVVLLSFTATAATAAAAALKAISTALRHVADSIDPAEIVPAGAAQDVLAVATPRHGSATLPTFLGACAGVSSAIALVSTVTTISASRLASISVGTGIVCILVFADEE